jgi:hypothetical protein
MVNRPLSIVKKVGGSGWESNPPRPATRPATGFEDQEAHRDLTTPMRKDNRRSEALQAALSLYEYYLKNKRLSKESLQPGLGKLKYQDNPPRVNQHHYSEQSDGQAISSACLLVTYTQIFHDSLEFFFCPFHGNRVISKHNILSFNSYDENKGKMSQPIRVIPTTTYAGKAYPMFHDKFSISLPFLGKSKKNRLQSIGGRFSKWFR